MGLTMTDVQSAVATISAVTDSEGNPATLDGPPTWESSNPGTVIVQAAPDGMSAVVSSPSPGPLGKSTLTVRAKSAGVDLVATADVEIIASSAVALGVNFGAPA